MHNVLAIEREAPAIGEDDGISLDVLIAAGTRQYVGAATHQVRRWHAVHHNYQTLRFAC